MLRLGFRIFWTVINALKYFRTENYNITNLLPIPLGEGS